MTDTFKKLNFKGQKPILVYRAPASFLGELALMAVETEIHIEPAAGASYGFILAFAEMHADLMAAASLVLPAIATDTPIVWFAYPKQTSKAFSSDLNRERCWQSLQYLGLQPVRQIAIDEDWSALRYKKV